MCGRSCTAGDVAISPLASPTDYRSTSVRRNKMICFSNLRVVHGSMLSRFKKKSKIFRPDHCLVELVWSKSGGRGNCKKKRKCRRPGVLSSLFHLRVSVRNLKLAELLRNFLQYVSYLWDAGPPGVFTARERQCPNDAHCYENLKRSKHREDSSDLDDFLIELRGPKKPR